MSYRMRERELDYLLDDLRHSLNVSGKQKPTFRQQYTTNTYEYPVTKRSTTTYETYRTPNMYKKVRQYTPSIESDDEIGPVTRMVVGPYHRQKQKSLNFSPDSQPFNYLDVSNRRSQSPQIIRATSVSENKKRSQSASPRPGSVKRLTRAFKKVIDEQTPEEPHYESHANVTYSRPPVRYTQSLSTRSLPETTRSTYSTYSTSDYEEDKASREFALRYGVGIMFGDNVTRANTYCNICHKKINEKRCITTTQGYFHCWHFHCSFCFKILRDDSFYVANNRKPFCNKICWERKMERRQRK